MGIRTIAAVAGVIGVAMSSCSSDSQIDRDAWRSEIESHPSVTSIDQDEFASAQDQWISDCQLDDDEFARVIAAEIESMGDELLRITIRHACPHRLAEADELMEALHR